MSDISARTSDAAAETRDPDLARARDGDDAAFTRLVGPLRRELHAHCYRMLGSSHDADDALQDALLRAWRGFAGFEGRSTLRSWLYTVATRTCLDAVASRGKRALPVDLGPSSDRAVIGDLPVTDVAWLGPYADTGLPAGPAGPDARYEQREAVELAFVAALQHLPGNQRAALLLFEVLGFSVAEIAAVMDTTRASVNSALQRARVIVAEKVPPVTQAQTLRDIDDARVRALVVGYATALERGDADALVALLTEDVTWSMPPMAHWYRGLGAVADFAVRVPLTGCGAWRHVPITANGQPAVAFYLWDEGARTHLRWSITVLTLRGDSIADLTSFLGAEHFVPFGLPESLP
ncbi:MULTISPECIES: sigma-70 family RNA polymerase sigma factor [unclassified Rhodococcus (in: high G+C Gram-positive bacteria)]|uniref:sigma-70 family RNA polymerase sigma factor n=1 Tax=unclassified Rhodococcus (in: high G+C Gram-positive bacteria) TaxID=192944 RepID=UPI001639ACB9|nr:MULTISPECIES: sigma-70 family RNA polymerase sigma factor [unclassified Rhodococcus (in: high G+C Gram-positive bacteria)]MBC2638062.1 sigma-70 family RNA polymerase sigma factor [Rhodococcus sp. 3A]MBC2897191.1 sigma-70 family RNA polymerase sigma factor [Rhodococcus sp. 4CII]